MIREGFQWLVGKFLLLIMYAVALWVMVIILVMSKIVGKVESRESYAETYTKRLISENKRVFDELGEDKMEAEEKDDGKM